MALKGRFRVEVQPRFVPAGMPAPPRRPSPTLSGPPPRLTELAVAFGLDGSELDAELASVRAQRSKLAAYEAGLIERKATLGARHALPLLPGARTDIRTDPADRDLDPDPALQAADDFLPDEVAVLLNMSVPSTRHHVDHALTLVRQLPVVWHALADQRIDETRAKVIVRALGYQALSYGGPVPDRVIDDVAALGVEWAARGCAPTTLRERLDTALIAADPAAADRRRHLRKRTADVTAAGTGDSLAELKATQLDAADATLVRAQIDAYARQIKTDGDPRPLGQIRVSVLVALITRPWEQLDPAIAHLTIHADLADLHPDLITTPDDQPTQHHPAGPGPAEQQPAENEPEPEVAEPEPAEPEVADPEVAGNEVAADEVARDELAGDELADDELADDEPARDGSQDDPPGAEGAADGMSANPVTGDWTAAADPAHDGPTAPQIAGNHSAPDQDTPTPATGTAAPTGPSQAGHADSRAGNPGSQARHGDRRTDYTGSRAGHLGGLPVTPAAVRALLERIDALGLTNPIRGHLTFTITGPAGRLLAVATPDELAAAARAGSGLAPPGPAPGYTPTAAQYRYLRARDRHCRFPGCRQVAIACDTDHVNPYNHHRPATGGPTCTTNLVMLCRHHHRLKTHAKGWGFRLDPDGTLHVTTPGGTTRTTRPPAADQILDLTTGTPPPYDPDADPPPF